MRKLSLAWLPWALWAALTTSDLVLVGEYGCRFPYMDEWEMVPAATGHVAIDWNWIWQQHNEHRFVLARLLLLGLYRLAGFDFRAAVFVNVSLMAAVAAAMMWTARRLRGRTALADAFFPLALLHFGHGVNFFWSWQLVYIIPVAVAGILLVTIAGVEKRLTSRSVWVIGFCFLLLPLSGGIGIVLVPAIGLWAFAGVVVDWRSGRKRDAFLLAGFLLAAALLSGFYFVGLRKGPVLSERAPWFVSARTVLQFMSVAFGLIDIGFWWAWGTAAAILLGGSMALIAWAVLRRPGERLRALGLLAFLAASVALGLGVGWGRPGFGLEVRYTTLAVLGICGVYFVWELYGGRAGQLVPLFLCLVYGVMLYPNTQSGIGGARAIRSRMLDFSRDLRAGLPPLALADRYSHEPFALCPGTERVREWLGMLHDTGAKPYRELRPDPDYRTVSLTPEMVTCPDDHHFVLKQPRFVYAVRFQYAYRPRARLAFFRFTWEESGTARERAIEFPLLQTEAPKSLLIWVEAPLKQFAVFPDNKPCSFNLWQIELLVPPTDMGAAR